MDLEEENQKRSEFKQLLLDLSKEPDALENKKNREEIYKKVESIYAPNTKGETFRHFYSDIFSTLTRIKNEKELGDTQLLGQNVCLLYEDYKKEREQNNQIGYSVSRNLCKLYDHLNLDISRLDYSEGKDKETAQEASIKDLKAKINVLENSIKEATSKAKEAEEKGEEVKKELKDLQKEYVAILGIFSGIVLSFTAATAFSSSVFENMHQSSIYRVILVTLVIGIVLINVFYVLFNFVGQLSDQGQRVKDLKTLVISNIILIILIVGVIHFWKTGFVENRDANINKYYATTSQSEQYLDENT